MTDARVALVRGARAAAAKFRMRVTWCQQNRLGGGGGGHSLNGRQLRRNYSFDIFGPRRDYFLIFFFLSLAPLRARRERYNSS